MKALLLHCKNYHIEVRQLANRPINVEPEAVTENSQSQTDCIAVLITIEKKDTIESTTPLIGEIKKMANDVGRKNVVILPFAHLSSNLASSEISIPILENIKDRLAEEFNVMRGHFVSHKEYLLDVYGHAGNTRFREY
jgi:threonyl-tRNA synthetase